jgi:glycosyltransferase involved in cell wall biosynthesis
MKKVVYLCPNGYIGGAERFVLEAANGHIQYGQWQPTIIFFNDGPAVLEAKERKIPNLVLKTRFRLSRPLSLIKAILELRKILKDYNFDLYNATMPYAHIVGALAGQGLSLKRTWYQHGPVGGRLDVLASFLPVDQIYFNSEYTRGEHFRHPLHTNAKMKEKIIPIGIPDQDVSDAETIRKQYLKSPQGLLILTGGRITETKGFENAIIAFQNALKTFPNREMILLIAGEAPQPKDLTYLDQLKALAQKEIECGKVLFLGQKTNMASYMKACDIFLHTTKIPEAFGLVIAEAMKQETLVIGTSSGGSSDILKNRETGFSFDSTSDKAANELTKILNHALQTNCSSLVAKGKELIDEKFSIREMTSQLEEQFNLVLSQ